MLRNVRIGHKNLKRSLTRIGHGGGDAKPLDIFKKQKKSKKNTRNLKYNKFSNSFKVWGRIASMDDIPSKTLKKLETCENTFFQLFPMFFLKTIFLLGFPTFLMIFNSKPCVLQGFPTFSRSGAELPPWTIFLPRP